MYCEAERAKLTRMLSALKERQGDVASAADILQDVNVETCVFCVRIERATGTPRGRRGPGVRARRREPRPTRRRHVAAVAATPSRATPHRTRDTSRAEAPSPATHLERHARATPPTPSTHIKRRYGALSKREKVDYILDQVRLMLAKGDRVRGPTSSRKKSSERPWRRTTSRTSR